MTTLCERMAGFFKALGLDGKPEYAEKIPETLTAEDISLHEVRETERERGEERPRKQDSKGESVRVCVC